MEQILEEKLIPLLKKLIANECVNTGAQDSGHEIRSAVVLKEFFDSYGISSQIIESYPGRANLLVRIPGTNPMAPSLMYMGHMDVVPAQASRWKYPPFEGRIEDGYLYARGAVDMLNLTAAMAVGIAERFRLYGPAAGDLVFLALADEEASGRYGARYLTEKYWDKVRADYLIGELGGFWTQTDKGKAVTLAVGEKGIAWCRLSVKGTPGHGSMPYKADNAIDKIAKIVRKISKHPEYVRFSAAYLSMADALGQGKWEKSALKNRFLIPFALRAVAKRSLGMAKFLHGASRMTVSPGYLSGGDKINIIPASAYVDLDIRILPGQTPESVQEYIYWVIGSERKDIKIEFLEYFPSAISSTEGPLCASIIKCLEAKYPDTEIVPMFISSVTDARFWRQKGTVAYGFSIFSPAMTLTEYSRCLHGIDERIDLASLKDSVDFFTQLPEVFSQSL